MPFGVGGGMLLVFLTSLALFPKLALGLSGFETGVAVMPLVRGDADDDHDHPRARIRNTKKLLATAAVIMSVMLLGSSLVVATLIDPQAFEAGSEPTAKDRALAFLAHGQSNLPISPIFGELFGTIYDLSTVLILWFAGASAMAGLLNLVPRYLPRYGMAPEWAGAIRPLVLVITASALVVTTLFAWELPAAKAINSKASLVSLQGEAYATGVLALMSSAGVAVFLGVIHPRWAVRGVGPSSRLGSFGFGVVMLAFLYTTIMVIWTKPVGLHIALIFITLTIAVAAASRIWRSRELRLTEFRFQDESERMLWLSMIETGMPFLVPHRPTGRSLQEKAVEIRGSFRIPTTQDLVFLQVHRGDTSEFGNSPVLEIREEEGFIVLEATDAVSVSHTIAAIALELSRGRSLEVLFGWTVGMTSTAQSLGYLLFGEGNVPLRVRELIEQAPQEAAKKIRIVVG